MMEVRLTATRYIWVAFALTMFGLFGSTVFGNNGGLGWAHVVIACVVAFAAFISTGFVWSWGEQQNHLSVEQKASKQKRGSVDRLADELDSMSDQDLERLRTRLSGDVREVLMTPSYSVTEEGELRHR
jgi:hypothetical protein